MKFGTGLIIFFLALIALVAEIILYFVFGISLAIGGGEAAISGFAKFFGWLVIMTIVTAVMAPVSGIIENISKKENLGMYVFLAVLLLAGIGSGAIMLLGGAVSKKAETAAPKSASSWKVDESASPMDSTKTVTLSLDATEEIQGWLQKSRPTLIVRCKEKKAEVFILTNQSAQPEGRLDDTHSIRIRLDEAKPISARWSASTDGNALFAPNSSALADQLAAAKVMRFEFTPLNANRATVTFNVAGLAEHLPEVKAACSK